MAAFQSKTASAPEVHRGPLSPTQLYQVPCPYSLWLRSLSKAREASGVCRHTGLRQNRSPVRIGDQLEIKLLLPKWVCRGAPLICTQKSSSLWAIDLLTFKAAGLPLVFKKMTIKGRVTSLYLETFTIPYLLFLRMLLDW